MGIGQSLEQSGTYGIRGGGMNFWDAFLYFSYGVSFGISLAMIFIHLGYV